MSFVITDEFSVKVKKLLQVLVSHELTVYLPIFDLFLTHEMTILSKGRKPDNFESHNSLKLSFTNIRGLPLNFVKCDDSIDSRNFSVRGYLPLIGKDSITHMYGLAVYTKDFFLHRT